MTEQVCKNLPAGLTASYHEILKKELIPAMGCTEPIAVAYAAAIARDTLGMLPDRILLEVSGNIIKNVKSVIVPNTGGLKGLEAAVAAGTIAGDPVKKLEVISCVSQRQLEQIREYLGRNLIQVRPADTNQIFDIFVTAFLGSECAKVRIAGYHTHIVLVEKNGNILQQHTLMAGGTRKEGYDQLNVRDILTYAQTADISPVREVLERQIAMNTAISRAGIKESWGACIGKSILQMHAADDLVNRAKAAAAAGSDARMSGCELPVVINSGSGNQGITVCMPIVTYAEYLRADRETTLRALALGNLLAIHLKTGIGPLSAYCGAVTAGCAAGAAVSWLNGGGYDQVVHTLVNALAINSGIVCDGAKPSCAAKIASAVEGGLMGWQMYLHGNQFRAGEGIVGRDVEETIQNVARLGRNGMKDTDREILRIMTGN